MIKVTNEMVILIEEYIETFQEHLYHNAEELARKIIELHEQSKPKPEPYGYVNGISSTDLWFPQDLSDSAKNSDRWTPLYTTPPTRETLSQFEHISVAVRRELFRFSDMNDWVNNAQQKFASCGVKQGYYIAVDAQGHVTHIGKCFMSAKNKQLYPVVVYELKTNWSDE